MRGTSSTRLKMFAAWGAVCAILAAGCGGGAGDDGRTKAESQPTTTRASQPASAPGMPEQFKAELTAGTTEILVNPDTAGVLHEEPTYVQKADAPCGKLSGVCRFVGRPQQAPPHPAEDLVKGPYAIRDPVEGEVDYYQNIKIRGARYFARTRRREIRPSHVVLMFRDVTEGRRAPLKPTGFFAMHGYVRALSGNYGGRTNITFTRPNTRVTFFTYEAYPCTFRLTRAEGGKRVFEGRVTYKDQGAKRAKEVGGGHKIWIASKPDPIQTPILRDLGLYKVTTKRHPWKLGYVFLVDNPYVAVVGGSFDIADLPVGKHRMDIWHPAYEPLAKTVEFEIFKDETTEVAIEFKRPSFLKPRPARR